MYDFMKKCSVSSNVPCGSFLILLVLKTWPERRDVEQPSVLSRPGTLKRVLSRSQADSSRPLSTVEAGIGVMGGTRLPVDFLQVTIQDPQGETVVLRK